MIPAAGKGPGNAGPPARRRRIPREDIDMMWMKAALAASSIALIAGSAAAQEHTFRFQSSDPAASYRFAWRATSSTNAAGTVQEPSVGGTYAGWHSV